MVDATGETENLVDQHEGDDEKNGVADLASEARRSPLQKQIASPGPELGKNVELNECNVADLREQTVDERELGFGTTVGLGFIEDILGDFLGENFRGLSLLKNAVLTESEERFEEVLADVEADDELLPGEQRPVEEPRKAL